MGWQRNPKDPAQHNMDGRSSDYASESGLGFKDSKLHQNSGEIINPELVRDSIAGKGKMECAAHSEFFAGGRQATEIASLRSGHFYKLHRPVPVNQQMLGDMLSVGKRSIPLGITVQDGALSYEFSPERAVNLSGFGVIRRQGSGIVLLPRSVSLGEKLDNFFASLVKPGAVLKEPFKMYLDLWHGKCRDAFVMTGAETKKPEFTISGTIETYRQIFNKKLDPIQALMTRKLELQGNMMKIMKSVKATLDLVNCCGLIDMKYPDQK